MKHYLFSFCRNDWKGLFKPPFFFMFFEFYIEQTEDCSDEACQNTPREERCGFCRAGWNVNFTILGLGWTLEYFK